MSRRLHTRLAASATAWGVAASYRDAFERRRVTPERVRRRVLEAMGVEPGETPPAGDPVVVVHPGDRLDRPCEVVLEDGTSAGALVRIPTDLPIGYHRLRDDGGERHLLVAPRRCRLPTDRAWGVAVQAYAARSEASWGIGDLDDLRRLAAWTRAIGAGCVAVSPIWAPNPGSHPEASPYFPSTRRFLSPLALAVERVPGASAAGSAFARLARRGRALNRSEEIDRTAVWALKREALWRIWEAGGGAALLDERPCAAFMARSGASLRQWATFAAIGEAHGAGWATWPVELRDSSSRDVRRFADAHREVIGFHAWLQYLLDCQLRDAGAAQPLVTDLPVGTDPRGFDAWSWPGLLAAGASVGAPPDRFNAAGQEWGLPPFIPHRLRAAGYRPLGEILRVAMRHAGGLRIDHVLGLFRLWWIPRGESPADGAYVRYRGDELLAVLAIESHRAGAFVIGEDLGTVPRGVRSRLRAAGVLGMRVIYFERQPPASWPRLSVAAVTTHDLPTMAGLWTGSDLDDQAAAGVAPDAVGAERLRERVAAVADISPHADAPDAILAVHRALAAAPSLVRFATLEDALGVERRPNLPGTVSPQRSNWSVALPTTLEEIERDPFVAAVTHALAGGSA
jgi:4-alpha-glucanotransferase